MSLADNGDLGPGRVAGKVALISGGAQGLGASQVGLLAAHGARVMIGDVNDGRGDELAARVRAQGFAAAFVHLDVTQEADWHIAIDRVEAEFGAIDVLVNNAGILHPEGFEEETLDGWMQVLQVNQTGTFLGIRTVAPSLRKAGGGSIINLASISGIIGQSGFAAYQATKGAIRQMTRAAAMQYAGDKIRVNAVCPGVINSDMLEGASEEYKARRTREMPLGRFGEPIEIAYGVLFLASDESSYITGIDLLIDGGLVAH